MKNEIRIRNRDLFMSVLRNPKDHVQAFAYLAMSGVCVAGTVLLNFIR